MSWESQAGGWVTRKDGTVLAYIHANATLTTYLPNGIRKQDVKGQDTSCFARYLVAVPRTHRTTGEPLSTRYYTPIASLIEAQYEETAS